MSKTVLPRKSGYLFSPSFLFGYTKELCRSYGVTFIVASVIFIMSGQTSFAQGPYCSGFNCTANDVQTPSYFIGDAAGNPLVSDTCVPGQPVTNVYLWLTFTVTATNRYDINVIGDVLLDGVYNSTLSVCLGDLNSGTYTMSLGQIVWTCGVEMTIANTLFAWEVNDDGQVPNTCNTCPDQSSKCARFANLTVFIPIVANFSIATSCPTGQANEVYTFTNETTGGAPPYSNYVWSFGAGSTPTPSTISGPTATGPFTVTYSSPGIRTVSLTVTDAVGTTSTISYQINVQPSPTVNITSTVPTICPGGSSTLTANVTGGTGPFSYQWQQLVSSVWTNVGTNQNTYISSPLSAGTYTYRVIVTQPTNCSIMSPNHVITVVADPTVVVVANDLSICEGGTSTFTATVTGGTGSTVYQWQYNNAGTWTNVGTNSNVFTTPPLLAGTHTYRLLVNQSSGCFVQSPDQVVTVVADPVVNITANDASICTGGTSLLTANVTGGNGVSHYQWQFNNAGTWTNVGTDQNTYTTPVLTTGTYTYRVLLTQDAGCAAQSADFVVTAVNDPVVTVVAEPATFCTGGTSTMTATVTGGAGTSNYQWQTFTGGVWTNVGTNSNIYTTPVLNTSGTYNYRVIVTQDAGCQTITTQDIIVVGDPTVTVTVDDASICTGGVANLTAVVTGGAGTNNYQWQYNNAGTWTNVGTNQNTYQTPVHPVGTHEYRVIVTQNNGCVNSSTGTASITVVADPTITVTANDASICNGGTALLTGTVSGGNGTSHYQWQFNNAGTWENVGADQNTYTTPALATGTYSYRVLVTQDAGCAVQSADFTVTAVDDPIASISTDQSNICTGGTSLLTATVTGGSGTTVYQWQWNNAGTWTNVGSNQNTYLTAVLNTPGTFSYRVL